MRAKFINEKFLEDSDPIYDLKIGFISKINSEILELLYEFNEHILDINDIEEYCKNYNINFNVFLTVKNMLEKEDIQFGKYLTSYEIVNKLDIEISKMREKSYNYVYNSLPNDDGVLPVYSKIKLPGADKVDYEIS